MSPMRLFVAIMAFVCVSVAYMDAHAVQIAIFDDRQLFVDAVNGTSPGPWPSGSSLQTYTHGNVTVNNPDVQAPGYDPDDYQFGFYRYTDLFPPDNKYIIRWERQWDGQWYSVAPDLDFVMEDPVYAFGFYYGIIQSATVNWDFSVLLYDGSTLIADIPFPIDLEGYTGSFFGIQTSQQFDLIELRSSDLRYQTSVVGPVYYGYTPIPEPTTVFLLLSSILVYVVHRIIKNRKQM